MPGLSLPAPIVRALLRIQRTTGFVVRTVLFAGIGVLILGPAFIGVGAGLFYSYQFLPGIGWLKGAYMLGTVIAVFQAYRYGHRLLKQVGGLLIGIDGDLYPGR